MPAPTPTLITGTNGVGGVTYNSLQYDCVMGSWRGQFNKQFFQQVTFCSGGWVDESSGMKQFIGMSTGYLSHGNAISDPLLDFSATLGVSTVLQADVGCQLTMTAHIEKDMGVIAAGPSEFGVRLRSRNVVGSAWNLST